jgi:hypothetical protein
VRDRVLQQQLRPARRIDLGGPVRQRFALHFRQQAAAAATERHVDQHRDSLVLRELQDAFRPLVLDGVVDLDEVERTFLQCFDHLRVLLVRGRGHADVADLACLLCIHQHRKQLLHAAETVDLEQVDLLHLQTREAQLQRCCSGGPFPWRRRLGRDEELVAVTQLFHEIADDDLGIAVAPGGIHHLTA